MELISNRAPEAKRQHCVGPINNLKLKVVFAIITHADSKEKSENLPLFSKISLMRNMQQLDLYEVPSEIIFVSDESSKKTGHKKYKLIDIEVFVGERGRPAVRALPGQDVDPSVEIIRCSKEVSTSPIGSRWKIGVKLSEDGRLSSHHSWPIERQDQQQLEAALSD